MRYLIHGKHDLLSAKGKFWTCLIRIILCSTPTCKSAVLNDQCNRLLTLDTLRISYGARPSMSRCRNKCRSVRSAIYQMKHTHHKRVYSKKLYNHKTVWVRRKPWEQTLRGWLVRASTNICEAAQSNIQSFRSSCIFFRGKPTNTFLLLLVAHTVDGVSQSWPEAFCKLWKRWAGTQTQDNWADIEVCDKSKIMFLYCECKTPWNSELVRIVTWYCRSYQSICS